MTRALAVLAATYGVLMGVSVRAVEVSPVLAWRIVPAAMRRRCSRTATAFA
jgi:hypothetical protein